MPEIAMRCDLHDFFPALHENVWRQHIHGMFDAHELCNVIKRLCESELSATNNNGNGSCTK
jgi:hypothetical protein